MKSLNTLLPLRKWRSSFIRIFGLSLIFLTTFPSFSQCDINIFQRGTSATGSVSLMPWLSYTSGCEISNDCGQLSELVVWDMEDVDPCKNGISKPNISECKVDVGTSAVISKSKFSYGSDDSDFALAIGKGQVSRFKTEFKPTHGQSGEIINLIYSVKSLGKDDLICKENVKLNESLDVEYSIAILSRGKQIYMGLKKVSSLWEEEIIDLDYICDGENLYSNEESLELEIIITNFTTFGNTVLGLDNLILEGKECMFNDNLAYEWSNGATTEKISSIEKGNYCVTVTDCNGCQAVDCISVN